MRRALLLSVVILFFVPSMARAENGQAAFGGAGYFLTSATSDSMPDLDVIANAPTSSCVATIEHDRDGDGTIDGVATLRIDSDREEHYEHDYGHDGPDFTWHRVSDSRGRTVRQDQTSIHDPFDHHARCDHDDANRTSRCTYTSRARPTTSVITRSNELDRVERTETLDAQGAVISSHTTHYDDDARTVTHRYDNGLVHEHSHDGRRRLLGTTSLDATGQIAAITRRTLHEGRIVRDELDWRGDGNIDAVTTWQRNARGDVTRIEWSEEDPSRRGATTYEYERDRVVRSTTWNVERGDLRAFLEYRFSWRDGKLVRASAHDPASGATWRTWTLRDSCDRPFPEPAMYADFVEWKSWILGATQTESALF